MFLYYSNLKINPGMKKFYRHILILLSFVVLFSSCVDMTRNIVLNKDGSGSEKMNINIGPQFFKMMQGLAALDTTKKVDVYNDSMIVTAAIEYGDRICKRSTYGWARSINIRIPVHNPEKWNAHSVYNSLHEAVQLLTGDYWKIEFVSRSKPADIFSETY